MRKWLASIFTPFAVIARELTIIRELYELELSQRKPPIIRVTEKATESDTEVTYGSEYVEREKGKLQRLMEGLEAEEDEDDG